MSKPTILLLALCLTACAGPQATAFRDGTGKSRTEADMRQDEATCRYEIATAMQGRPAGPAYFVLCMEAKGWRRA